MAQDHGWISFVGNDISHLTDEQREWVEERIRQRQEARGGLLAVVEVRVYEHGCEPQISFPSGSTLGVDSGGEAMADIVARARTELANWR